MYWFRKSFLQLCTLLLLLSLFALAGSVALVRNFGSPTQTKQWLQQSKVYDNVTAATIERSSKTASGSNAALYTNSAVLQLADRAFSQAAVTQVVNTVLDANYAWLNGKTSAPSFSIDLSDQRASFAKQTGDYVALRLAQLPVCTTSQLLQLQVPVDPLTIACRPPTIDAKTEGLRVQKEILASDFLKQSVLTSRNIQSGTPFYERFPKAPQAFQAAQKLPYVLLAITLLSALAVVFLARERQKGFRRIASLLLFAGIVLGLVFVAVSNADTTATKVLGNDTPTALRRPLGAFVRLAVTDTARVQAYVGAVYIVLGAAILIMRSMSIKRSTTSESTKPVRTSPPTAPANESLSSTRNVTNPVRPQSTGRSMDIMGPVKPRSPKPKPVASTPTPALKKQPRPRRPRLIQ